MPVGRPLGAKLFLEGKEVPFLGASIVNTVGQASIAYIDLVPHKTINEIKPRTHVVIAVRDYNNVAEEFPYVYAWEGEVFGYSFSKTPNNRSFSISCIDLSSYWDNVLTYFINPVTSLAKGAMSMAGVGLNGVTAEKSGVPIIATSDSLASLLFQTIKEGTAEEDFLTGFAKLYKKMALVNGFYKIAETRLRIFDRVLIQSSKKLQGLLEEDQALKWFEGIIGGSLGGFSTLRAVVQELMGAIFHDFTSVPFPARVQTTSKDFISASVGASPAKKKYTVGNFLFKPNLYMIPPPMCNVFFPDEYSNFQYSRNFFKEPTRMIYKPELPLYLNSGAVTLAYQFEPPSLQHFMTGKGDFSKFQGDDDFAVAQAPGHFADDDDNKESSQTNNKKLREGQFLTKEEKLKGVWMSIESLVPAASTFRQEVSDAQKALFIPQITKYLFFKKRYENRSLQITSHLKLSVVPGFNILLLDDSDAEQSTLAYCSSVSHRIFATEGGYTNVQLSYARSVHEEKVNSSFGNDPPIPPWFDEDVFGAVKPPPASAAAKPTVTAAGPQFVSPADSTLSKYYKGLLGDKGSTALSDVYANEKTARGSLAKLLANYQESKAQGSEVLQEFIAKTTGRDYIRISHFFAFLGAKLPDNSARARTNLVEPDTPKPTDIRNSSFNVFSGGSFDPGNKEFGDVLKTKFKIIDAYQKALKELRGFRG